MRGTAGACSSERDSLAIESIRPRSNSRGSLPAKAGVAFVALRADTQAPRLEWLRSARCVRLASMVRGLRMRGLKTTGACARSLAL
jgi:hypothetical protein